MVVVVVVVEVVVGFVYVGFVGLVATVAVDEAFKYGKDDAAGLLVIGNVGVVFG